MKLVSLHVTMQIYAPEMSRDVRRLQSPSYDKSILLEKTPLITSDLFVYLLKTLFRDAHLLTDTHHGSISMLAEGPALVDISSTRVHRYP